MWNALDSLAESSDVQLLAASGQSANASAPTRPFNREAHEPDQRPERGYAWTEEEWEDLWNDVLDLQRQPDDRHYMGALIVQGRSDVYVDDGAFERDFALYSLNPRGRKKLPKYIRCRLEADASGIARDPEAEPASIEHILPQDRSGDWAGALSAPEAEAATDRLGNTTLLEPAANRDIGNASYSEKPSVYGRSAYALTRHLAQRAVRVWRSDFA